MGGEGGRAHVFSFLNPRNKTRVDATLTNPMFIIAMAKPLSQFWSPVFEGNPDSQQNNVTGQSTVRTLRCAGSCSGFHCVALFSPVCSASSEAGKGIPSSFYLSSLLIFTEAVITLNTCVFHISISFLNIYPRKFYAISAILKGGIRKFFMLFKC